MMRAQPAMTRSGSFEVQSSLSRWLAAKAGAATTQYATNKLILVHRRPLPLAPAIADTSASARRTAPPIRHTPLAGRRVLSVIKTMDYLGCPGFGNLPSRACDNESPVWGQVLRGGTKIPPKTAQGA